MMDLQSKMFEIIIGDHVEDDGHELGLGHRFASSGVLVDWNGMPDDLSLLEERVVLKAVKVFDEIEEITNDGTGDDWSFVEAVMVEEAIEQDVLKGFGLDPAKAALRNGWRRVIAPISCNEG
jgi:hypothetical protein